MSAVRTRMIVLLTAAVAAAGIGYGILREGAGSAPGRTGASDAIGAEPVTVALAEARDVPIWLSSIGSVQPLNAVTVKARVDGQLDQVGFTEGQDVRAGDVLAKIDPRMYQAALDQAAAKQAQDLANLANARTDLTRYQKLAASSFAPAQQVDTQRATVAQLEAQVQQDQAAVEMARLQLGFTSITAPLDGRVGQRLVDPGSMIHASDPGGIVTITQMQPIFVLFAVPQDDLPEIRTAMTKGDVPVAAYTRDSDRKLADGRLVFVDSQVDQATGQIKLKALFDNADRILWPGQFVTARLLMKTIARATVVPVNAIERGQNGTYVFRVGQDDTVAVQPVTVSTTTAEVAIIAYGVAPGERIVTAGQYRLQPGTRIDPRPVTNGPGS